MRCLVVEDDSVAREIMERYVERHDALELVASCQDGIEAANMLSSESIDVLFLDVMLPEIDGLSLLRSMSHRPQVVLVSASPEYAVEAFDIEVVDYLLKPVSYARFLKAVERITRSVTTEDDTVFVKVEGRLVKVDLNRLKWIEAQGDYVQFHMEGKDLLVSSTMRKLSSTLPVKDFVRVHRSYIVRLDKIEDIEDTTIVIDRDVIPISASYKEELLSRLTRL
jgi:DNA-binding LytR/AlgR family response regulator